MNNLPSWFAVRKNTPLFAITCVLCMITCSPILCADTIAYTQLTDGYWQVWTQEDNNTPVQVTQSAFDKRTPHWLPDGGKILFRSANRELFIYDLAAQSEKQILPSLGWGTDAVFLNDREVLFSRFDSFLADESDLWVSDLSGEKRYLLTQKPGLEYAPAVSLDGSRIVFVSGKGAGTHELYLYELKTKQLTQLTKNEVLEMQPAWSPNGKWIAYASDETGNFEIYTMDLESRQTKQITDWKGVDLSPAWSPDGNTIAFTSDRSGVLAVWAVSSSGDAPVKLVQSDAPAQEASFKPLGKAKEKQAS